MFKFLLGVILCFSIISCGSDGGSSDDIGNVNVGSVNNSATVLEGRWLKSCSPVDDSHYDIVSITVSSNQFMSDIENYEDAVCTVPLSFSPNPTSDGTLTIGDALLTTGGLDATEVVTNITHFNGAPFILNAYDIFYIDGDNLYFGDVNGDGDTSTPDLRPSTLDFTAVFVRQ
jgi:hypothetical protein